jgi:hypothetical protein
MAAEMITADLLVVPSKCLCQLRRRDSEVADVMCIPCSLSLECFKFDRLPAAESTSSLNQDQNSSFFEIMTAESRPIFNDLG